MNPLINNYLINFEDIENSSINKNTYIINEKDFSVLLSEINDQKNDCDIDSVKAKLGKGQKIAETLLKTNEPMPPATKEDALDLIWFLMGCSYQENCDVFFRGTTRIVNINEEQSKRFKNFFDSCQEAHAHNRPSSHFKKETVGHQKGLDFEAGTLPLDRNLKTLLCGRLRDGSFFLKLEREALSWTKPMASAKHLCNWVKHAQSGGETLVGDKATRRETDGIGDLRQKTLSVISKASKVSEDITSEHKKPKGLKHIHQMHKTVSKISLQLDEMKRKQADDPTFVESSSMSHSTSTSTFEIASVDEESIMTDDMEHSPVPRASSAFIELAEKAVQEFHQELSAKKIKHPTLANGLEVTIDLKAKFS